MTTSRRRFAVQEKLSILEEAKKIGTMPAIRKHNLSYDVFLRWRNQFKKSAANPEVRALQLEIEKLKETIAQQALKLKPKKGASEKRRNRKRQRRAIIEACGFSNCSNRPDKAGGR
jgi:putative transposase